MPVDFDQSQAAFAVDPSSPQRIFGASNDTGLETLRVYESRNGGRTWQRRAGPVVSGGSCAHGAPTVTVDGRGRAFLAFLASPFCGDTITPYLVVASLAHTGDRWSPLVRIAPATWKFGFDDAPDIAADPRTGHLYLTWTRSLGKTVATTVVSTSVDAGRTWSPPTPVSSALRNPHRPQVAVGRGGVIYVSGIDARLGVWISRSTDGAKTFTAPRAAARLHANPARDCGITAAGPLPQELNACEGPDPTLSVGKDRVYVVYDDVGANQTPDVFVAGLDLELNPRFRSQVSPPDAKATQQFMPTSALDSTTGRLWACWYDTTFDPHAHRAWFTCSASRDGRRWSSPERAAKEPTSPTILYGTLGSSGLYPAATARNGVAHVFWGDGRVIDNRMDIFAAALAERGAFAVSKR